MIPVIFYGLGFFVCIVQSFVFTMLSAIYISGAVSHGHGEREEAITENRLHRRLDGSGEDKRRGKRRRCGKGKHEAFLGSFVMAVLGMLLIANPAFAETAHGRRQLDQGLIALAAGLGLGMAALGTALGQGRATAAAMESIGRNPNSADKIQTPLIIGLALMEALTLYALVIAFFLQGKIHGYTDVDGRVCRKAPPAVLSSKLAASSRSGEPRDTGVEVGHVVERSGSRRPTRVRAASKLLALAGSLARRQRTVLTLVPLSAVVPNPDQPRKHFAEERSPISRPRSRLAASSSRSSSGALPTATACSPASVASGAAKLAGLDRVPALIREGDDDLEIALIENLQREDLSPLEEAEALAS